MNPERRPVDLITQVVKGALDHYVGIANALCQRSLADFAHVGDLIVCIGVNLQISSQIDNIPQD